MNSKVLLIIMDGWGVAKPSNRNAITLANTPNYNSLLSKSIYTELLSSGEAVGLPEGQMGNSEVGHLNLGAGRIVYQDLTKINKSIREGTFFKHPLIIQAMEKARETNLHLMGLFSDGRVHSDIEHLKALIKCAKLYDVKLVFIDAFLDGRDTEPAVAMKYVEDIREFTNNFKDAKFSTIGGRYYGMDRDKRWDRLKLAYDAIVLGRGLTYSDPKEAIKAAYERGETDEFVKPSVILSNNSPNPIKDGDVLIFFNFRADRAREITQALTFKDFNFFEREKFVNINFYCMTQYDESFNLPVLFPKDELHNTVGEVISKKGLTQLRIAETEKYAHVTFFFSGGREEPFPNEERILIPSPKVPTYDLKPEMSAYEVTDALINNFDKGFDFILLNFANCDMVGHTGRLSAAISAVETVDNCIGRLYNVFKDSYDIIITADHGNAEEMIDENGNIITAHTTNKVPFLYLPRTLKEIKLKDNAYLRDVADIVLRILDIDKPIEMAESSIIL